MRRVKAMQQNGDDLISAAAAAKALGVNRSTISRQIKSGDIRSHEGRVRLSEVIEDRANNVQAATGGHRKAAVASPVAPFVARNGATPAAATTRADETIEEAAERIVFQDGRVFPSEAEAKRHKESFLALMRELDYDRENGAVVPVDDVVAAVAGEYALVRNRMLNIATRVAPRAAMLRSAEEVKALIDGEVALALQELSLDGRGQGGEAGDAARDAIQGRFRKPH